MNSKTAVERYGTKAETLRYLRTGDGRGYFKAGDGRVVIINDWMPDGEHSHPTLKVIAMLVRIHEMAVIRRVVEIEKSGGSIG